MLVNLLSVHFSAELLITSNYNTNKIVKKIISYNLKTGIFLNANVFILKQAKTTSSNSELWALSIKIILKWKDIIHEWQDAIVYIVLYGHTTKTQFEPFPSVLGP